MIQSPYTSQGIHLPSNHLNIMGYVDESEVNGPGRRAVVWVQGCHRGCPGCFNPNSQAFEINELVSVDEVVRWILSNPANEGVTFSGGEPFWQAIALAQVAVQVKDAGLTVMAFSGFTLAQLQWEDAPPGAQVLLAHLDILVDGPYVEALGTRSQDALVASRNQRVHVLNPALKDKLSWATNQVEIHILKDGSRLVTGYPEGTVLNLNT